MYAISVCSHRCWLDDNCCQSFSYTIVGGQSSSLLRIVGSTLRASPGAIFFGDLVVHVQSDDGNGGSVVTRLVFVEGFFFSCPPALPSLVSSLSFISLSKKTCHQAMCNFQQTSIATLRHGISCLQLSLEPTPISTTHCAFRSCHHRHRSHRSLLLARTW